MKKIILFFSLILSLFVFQTSVSAATIPVETNIETQVKLLQNGEQIEERTVNGKSEFNLPIKGEGTFLFSLTDGKTTYDVEVTAKGENEAVVIFNNNDKFEKIYFENEMLTTQPTITESETTTESETDETATESETEVNETTIESETSEIDTEVSEEPTEATTVNTGDVNFLILWIVLGIGCVAIIATTIVFRKRGERR